MVDYIDTRDMRFRDLPEKKPGRHRFIAIASFIISDEVARSSAVAGEDPAILDHENLWDVGVGCVDCEKPYAPDLKRYCEAPAYVPPERN